MEPVVSVEAGANFSGGDTRGSPRDLDAPNCPMQTRMPGGVAGDGGLNARHPVAERRL
jgi:hypothetical protein